MNTCATCKHWHGSDSSYRAKCEANSGVDTVSTAFDDTCSLWASKQPQQRTVTGHVTINANSFYDASYEKALRNMGLI